MSGGTNRDSTDKTDPLIGQVLNDRFEIIRLIGRGGVGAVYLAMQAPFDRPCALKVLRPRYQGEESHDFHRRFFLEASTAAKLCHPNNVAVFDYGHTDDGMYFMAMEYLEGRTLRDALRQDGPFSEERVTHIARQVCRALREAHHHGVIHRDIKPGNVFLLDRHDEKDVVKVLDFGLVKALSGDDGEDLTQANLFMGSPKYVSPEQIQSGPVDTRTDIYALGIVMYEMVTGRVPFDGGATVKTLIAHIKEDVPALRDRNPACEVSPLLERTIYRCISKDPASRFESMDELLMVLKQSPDAALTSTLLTDSGARLLIDSGALAISGSLPLPTTVTAPHGTTSGAIQPMPHDHDTRPKSRASWLRRRGKTLLASGAVLSAIIATVAMMGRKPPVDEPVFATSAVVEEQSSVPSSVPAVADSVLEAPNPPEPERFVVISTSPVSASVHRLDGKELCDETPCRIPADELVDGEATVELSAPGYIRVKQKIAADAEKVIVKLARIRVTAPPRQTAAPVPTGYKGDPFAEMPPY